MTTDRGSQPKPSTHSAQLPIATPPLKGSIGGKPGNGNGNGSGTPGQLRTARPDDLAPSTNLELGPRFVLPTGDGVRQVTLPGDAERPVFVLTMARSGSTLLRFILDSHPDLACPAETNIGPACFGLARLWDMLDPSPESAAKEYAPNEVSPELPPDAAASIRRAVDDVYGPYIARHGKRRWCDKSLDSAKMAELLAQLYPAAQFICLYRHCMDVVVSALDAAPWGLNGYGFEPYVMATPGNAVLAAARCWLDQTKAIIEFQDKYPDRCHGIRYEDLVTRPEEITEDLFGFLGVAAAPGITDTCLAQPRDARGPGDHKIWFTSRISADSLGQGTKIPIQLLPPEFLKNLNETLDQLAYRQIDDAWRARSGPIDPRADVTPETSVDELERHDAEFDAAVAVITGRLAGISRQQAIDLAERWPEAAQRTLCVAVEPPVAGAGGRRRCTLSCEDGVLVIRQDEEPPADAVTFAAAAATWLALLGGTANMAAELRANRLRFLDPSADSPHRRSQPTVTQLLAHLLGVAASGDFSTAKVPNPTER
jgi:Sulfotransferase family